MVNDLQFCLNLCKFIVKFIIIIFSVVKIVIHDFLVLVYILE